MDVMDRSIDGCDGSDGWGVVGIYSVSRSTVRVFGKSGSTHRDEVVVGSVLRGFHVTARIGYYSW